MKAASDYLSPRSLVEIDVRIKRQEVPFFLRMAVTKEYKSCESGNMATQEQFARGKPKDVLKLVKDAPVPRPAVDEVLVKVHSAALNPLGPKLMSSVPFPIARYPIVPENDFAGVVVDPNGHREWKVGQEVIGSYVQIFDKLRKGQGVLAEYANISTKFIIPKPPNVPFSQAAGLPIVGMTAYEGMFTRGKLTAGQRVFINGGSSSVGAMAIQIAKQQGATVVTSCSAGKIDFVKDLGADVVLDYQVSPLPFQLAKQEPFDLIMDCIGTIPVYRNCAKYLKPNRPYIAVGIDLHGLSTLQTMKAFLSIAASVALPAFLGGVPRTFGVFTMKYDEKALKEMADMLDKGILRVPIDSEYGWEKDDVMKAYDRQMSARAKGKIIIDMQREL
ncbi:hypothetical protein QFC21_004618 [Naganishia friedmannii]|uniref:Uncharacterized protein n=1 Tax=Naganishia friedmannii TaxID=89922 RepID=A0ACC2VDW4_9TREE|nr:hypothetical protein QFC21_004618 [Naganishia friedmannii]